MLFKNETVVRVVFAASVVFIAPMAIAADNNTTGWKYEDFQKCKADGNSKEECNNMAALATGGKGGSAEKCDKATDDFTKAKGEFQGACSKVNLPNEAGSCAKAIKGCGEKGSTRNAKVCPSKGADLDKLTDEAEKIQDKISELKTKVGTFDEKKAELTEQANKETTKINADIAKANAKFAEDQAKKQNEMTDLLSATQKKALAALQQAQSSYDQVTAQLKMIPIQEAQARLQNYNQKVTQLNDDCYDQGVKAANDQEQTDLKKIAAGQFKCAGLNGCFKRMTDEQSYEAIAAYFTHKCLISGKYTSDVNAANQVAQVAVQGFEAQKDIMVKQQSQALMSLTQAQSQIAQEQSAEVSKAKTAQAAAQQSLTTELGNLNNQLATVTNSTQNKIAAQDSQQRLVQSQMQEKEDYLKNKREALKVVQEASKGKDYSKEDAGKAEKGYADTTSGAQKGIKACGCKEENKDDSQCSLFADYLTDADLTVPWVTDSSVKPAGGGAAARNTASLPGAADAINNQVGPVPAYPPATQFYTPPSSTPPPFGDDAGGRTQE